ncbi:ATP-dependent RNA helicase [Aureococcus anophagefferens]|nr:ATP-dependent RNA helicase [Aureococcus anophagefferens]
MATVLPPPVEFRFTKRERDLVDAYLAAHGAEADDAATAPGAAAAPPPAPNGDWVRGELAKLRVGGAAATRAPLPRRGRRRRARSASPPASRGASRRRRARRVAAEWAGGGDGDGAALGGLVGYAVRGESRRRRDALEYVTTGALLRRLQEPGALARYTHVVVDEVHERSSDVDLLLLVLKRAVGRAPRRVVLISRAAASPRRRRRAARATTGSRRSARPRRARRSRRPPTRARATRSARWTSARRTASSSRRSAARAAPCRAEAGGAMLVFVPGVAEIDDVAARLAAPVVAPLHGRLSPAEQRAAFRPAPRGKTKVVVATDVAEASITLPDVTVVVDCGFARRRGRARARVVATTRVRGLGRAARAARAARCSPGTRWASATTSPSPSPRSTPRATRSGATAARRGAADAGSDLPRRSAREGRWDARDVERDAADLARGEDARGAAARARRRRVALALALGRRRSSAPGARRSSARTARATRSPCARTARAASPREDRRSRARSWPRSASCGRRAAPSTSGRRTRSRRSWRPATGPARAADDGTRDRVAALARAVDAALPRRARAARSALLADLVAALPPWSGLPAGWAWDGDVWRATDAALGLPATRERPTPVAAEIDGDRRAERALDALVASVPLRGGAAVRFRKHFLEKPAGRGGGKGGRGRGGRGKGRGKGDAPPKPPPKKAPPKKKKDDGALLAATLAEGKAPGDHEYQARS